MKRGLLLFTLLILTAPSLAADEIVLVADQWCPYNCAPEDGRPGFMVEIAEYAFAKEGHTVTYRTLPWARAIVSVREGMYHGIIGAGRDETPDFIFPDIEQGRATHTFFVKTGDSWKYEGLASLSEINLGVITHYSYGSLYEDYIKPNKGSERVQLVGGQNALGKNIKKLLHGRIDALIEDRNVFRYHLNKTSTPDVFSEAGVAYAEMVYIAFSPKSKTSETHAKILSNGMRELRATGKLAEILTQYGVDDWR